MPPNERDTRLMRRALELAARGIGRVEPNPMVGAVVARGTRVISEGYHERFGGPHAEVVALEKARSSARGADLFVSLEPCCHFGKTPPCTDAILAAGIGRVIAAVQDPFPEVGGKGIARLREAGVEVEVGLLEEQARRLNGAYFKRQETGLPLVIAKWAMTLDGRIATASGDSRWISSEQSRRRVHEVRRVADAVIVGAGTVLKDAPQLTVRHVSPLPERGQPTRVILDEALAIDPASEPAASAREVPVLVYTTAERIARQAERVRALQAVGCTLVPVERGQIGVSARAVVEDLGLRGMSRVLVEGGARVFASFFLDGLVDRVMVFINPRVLGAAGALGPVAGPDSRALADAVPLEDLTVDQLGPDVLLEGRLGKY